MRTALIIAFLVNVATSLASFVWGPELVGAHFAEGGLPDSRLSREAAAAISMSVDIALLALFLGAPSIIGRVPPWLVNLPNKAYWLAGGHVRQAQSIMAARMHELGCGLFVFLLWSEVLAFAANLRAPVRFDHGLFLGGLSLFVVYAIWRSVRFHRAFRVPELQRTE